MLDFFLRHRGLIIFTVGIIAAFVIFYTLRLAVIPFVVGLALAYILIPFITWAEKRLPGPGRYPRLKRVGLVLVSFLVMVGLAGTFIYFFATALVDSFQQLLFLAPDALTSSFGRIELWLDDFVRSLPEDISTQISAVLENAGQSLANLVKITATILPIQGPTVGIISVMPASSASARMMPTLSTTSRAKRPRKVM